MHRHAGTLTSFVTVTGMGELLGYARRTTIYRTLARQTDNATVRRIETDPNMK